MSNDALWSVYENAILRIGRNGDLTVDLRQALADEVPGKLSALGIGTQFAVITAYNPGGRNLFALWNCWRTVRMRFALTARRTRFVAASGESPDGSHRERGFAAAMSRSDAAAMARQYGQLAIYWFDGERFWLDDAIASRTPKPLPA